MKHRCVSEHTIFDCKVSDLCLSGTSTEYPWQGARQFFGVVMRCDGRFQQAFESPSFLWPLHDCNGANTGVHAAGLADD